MKVTLLVVLVLTYLSAALALPAISTRKIDDDIEIIPLEKQNPYGDQPIVDTGVGFSGPFANPFSGLFENIEGIMARLRQQMEALLKRFPVIRANASSEEIPDFPVVGGLPSFPNFGDIDLGKGNTTSVTKVINGHKVVINETEYKDENDYGGTFFKVRIVDVHPDNSELTTNKDAEEVTTAQAVIKDREPLENSVENEISKSREATSYDNIESFDEVDDARPLQKIALANRDTEWNDIEPIESFEDNSINYNEKLQPIDLSRDIYVNQIMADAGAPTDPDAEVFYVREPPQRVNYFGKYYNPR